MFFIVIFMPQNVSIFIFKQGYFTLKSGILSFLKPSPVLNFWPKPYFLGMLL